jgi:gliding motility-associated lipoprotein GldH
MKKLLFLLSFCLFSTLFSCVQPTSYSETSDDFPENHWLKDESKAFNFSIKESDRNYDLSINLSHVYDFQYVSVPMTISIIGSDNKEQIINFDLKIKDKSGKDLGDCSGDICNLKQLIKENITLSKGDYKIIVKQNFKGKYLPNIIAVGIELKNKK